MIKDLLEGDKNHISFEVFPPKKEDEFDGAFEVMDKLSKLSPDFISVTYGAGGSRSKKTIEIASYITNTLGIDSICHMTCVGATRNSIREVYEDMKKNNLNNLLALRGDRPAYMTDEEYFGKQFDHATDLVEFIRNDLGGKDMIIAGACYPEKHFESPSLDFDIDKMLLKEECGVSFFISQLFFDNDIFYRFIEKARKAGVKSPILPGIMPLVSANMLGTTVSLSGSSVPKELTDLVAKYADNPSDMRKAGVEYAIKQIRDLRAHEVDGIHLYSMNRPKTTEEIIKGI